MGAIYSKLLISESTYLKSRSEASKKGARCFETYHHQNFALPNSLVHYISKNPSTSKLYQKLTMTCKYFYIKNPIVVIPSFYSYADKNGCYINIDRKNIDLNKITSKLWITDEICFTNSDEDDVDNNIISTIIIPKIFKCDIKYIGFLAYDVSFKEFIFLASKCESIWVDEITVLTEDGSVVSLEKLVKALPKLKKVSSFDGSLDDIITSNTVKELLKIPHFSNLDTFKLYQVPEAFDIDVFYGYIKRNKKTKIALHFADSISDNYKARLQTIVDEILQTENHDYKIPFIEFPGMADGSYDKLYSQAYPKSFTYTYGPIACIVLLDIILFTIFVSILYMILKNMKII